MSALPNQSTNNKCLWIGIGLDINLEDEIYPQLTKLNRLLNSKYHSNYEIDQSINPFHLNLYDLDIPETNLAKVDQILSTLAKKQLTFSINLTKIDYFEHGTIFIQCDLTPQLKKLEQKVVEKIVQFKGDCQTKDYWQPHRKYNLQQLGYRNRYGNPHVLQSFNPHLSIGYVKTDDQKLTEIVQQLNQIFEPMTFRPKQINLAIQNSTGKLIDRRCYPFS